MVIYIMCEYLIQLIDKYDKISIYIISTFTIWM